MDAQFFPIGAWLMFSEGEAGDLLPSTKKGAADYFNRTFERLSQHNFNTAMVIEAPIEHFAALSRAARKHGLKLIYGLPGTANKDSIEGALTKRRAEKLALPAVERIKDCPELIGYYICDEPSFVQEERYIKNLLALRRAVRSVDKERPVLSCYNVPAMTGALFRRIKPEVLLIDPYVLNAESPLGHLASFIPWVEYSRGIAGDTPLWLVLQAHGSVWGRRAPTPGEVRKMVFLSLAHGAQGYFHFVYHWTDVQDTLTDRDGEPADGRLAEIGRLNAIAAKLAPIMLNVRPADWKPTTSDPDVEITVLADKDWYRTFKTQNVYFFLVNHSITESKIGRAWSYMGTAVLGDHYDILKGDEVISGEPVKFVLRADRELVSFTYELGPGEGKLFRLTADAGRRD